MADETRSFDQDDTQGHDNPQEDGGPPSMDAQYGQTHNRRPDKTEAERGQGRRTRQANKDIVSGRNP